MRKEYRVVLDSSATRVNHVEEPVFLRMPDYEPVTIIEMDVELGLDCCACAVEHVQDYVSA